MASSIHERSTPKETHEFLVSLQQLANDAPAALVVIPKEVREFVEGRMHSGRQTYWQINPFFHFFIETGDVPYLTKETGTLVWIGSEGAPIVVDDPRDEVRSPTAVAIL